MQTMVEYDILVIFYVNNAVQIISPRGVNKRRSIDNKIIQFDKFGTRLDDQFRSLNEHRLSLVENNLMYQGAKLYVTAHNPAYSDQSYENTGDVVEVHLESTAGEVRKTFNRSFVWSVKPMVILKLHYATRQI